MPTILENLWQSIIDASANLYDFLLLLNEFSVRFFESEFAVGLFGENATFNSVIDKYLWLPFLLMALSLTETFFGRRLLPALKLLIGFVTGFSIGAVYIAPQISRIVELDHLLVGLAFGIVIAVFKTPLYYTVLTSVLLYLFYYQLVNTLGFVRFWALAVSALAVILILLFLLKWVEYIGTSVIGAWLFAASLSLAVDFSQGSSAVLFKILYISLAVLGFLVQLKFRKIKKPKKEKQIEE